MKNAAAIALFLIVAAAAALPWVNGMVMERIVRDGLVRMNRTAPEEGSGLRFDLVSYDRGYAASAAEWKVDLGELGSVFGIREFRLTERASHGWTSVTSEISLEKNEGYARWAAGRGKDPLAVRTRYSLTGPVVTTVNLDSVTLERGNSPLSVGALSLTITTDFAFDHILTRGTWEGISGDDLPLEVSDLKMAVEAGIDRQAENMDIAVDISAGEMKAKEGSLSGCLLDLKVSRMDIRAYQALQAYCANLILGAVPAFLDPGIPPEHRSRLVKTALLENPFRAAAEVEKMMKKGFGIEISSLAATLPQGRVEGEGFLYLLRDMTLAGFIAVALRPDLALEIFALESRMAMPGEFLERNPALTMPLFSGMETGLFEMKDGRLHHQAATRDGKLYLNGRVVELEE